jgi:TPR repeat protein
MADLAVCYETGRGTEQDLPKAFLLRVRAALWGDAASIFEVG